MKKLTASALLDWIEIHIEEDITIATLVRISGYSRRFIHNLFCELIGIPPGKYIRRRKLTRAANLLRLTKLPCTQIGIALGFSSQQSFSREFKKVFGMSPNAYRNDAHWDFSTLCLPYKIQDNKMNITFSGVHTDLTPYTIYGCNTKFQEPIPYKGMNRNAYRKAKIIHNLQHSKDDAILLSSYYRSEMDTKFFNVNVFFGSRSKFFCKSDHKTVFSDTESMFACFIFQGTWDEYQHLPSVIYSEFLPTLNLQRRNDVDIEYFIYSQELMDNIDNMVSCLYFAPVKDLEI
ncbi:hypothetical protein CWG93_18910 [Salmonella enterica subsp. enterica serovar Sandiego]|nr:hypothetical protein [Salmonella enterica subsp. enterica serovar Sandiego]